MFQARKACLLHTGMQRAGSFHAMTFIRFTVTTSGLGQQGRKRGHPLTEGRPSPECGLCHCHSRSNGQDVVPWPVLQGRPGNVVQLHVHVLRRRRTVWEDDQLSYSTYPLSIKRIWVLDKLVSQFCVTELRKWEERA